MSTRSSAVTKGVLSGMTFVDAADATGNRPLVRTAGDECDWYGRDVMSTRIEASHDGIDITLYFSDGTVLKGLGTDLVP